MMKDSQIEQGSLTSYHLGYILGPRLNAKGRLEHAMDALRLLCTKDREKAERLAGLLSDTNDQKKQLVIQAISEAKMVIEKDKSILSQRKILVLSSQNWLPGIVGLVAARISEEYNLPTIAIARGEMQSKGSARSAGGIDIIQTLRGCVDLLLDVGGHPQAAGFTIETVKIEAFKTKLESVMETVEAGEGSNLKIEAIVDAERITNKWIGAIEKFEPFGIGNPRPKLASLGIKLSNLKTVGNNSHLKGDVGGLEFIAFGMGEMFESLISTQPIVDMIYFLEINKFNGSENLQLKVLDIKLP